MQPEKGLRRENGLRNTEPHPLVHGAGLPICFMTSTYLRLASLPGTTE